MGAEEVIILILKETKQKKPVCSTVLRGNSKKITIQDNQATRSVQFCCIHRYHLIFWIWLKCLPFRTSSSQTIIWAKYSYCAGIHHRRRDPGGGGQQSQGWSHDSDFDSSKVCIHSCTPLSYFLSSRGTEVFHPSCLTPRDDWPEAFAYFCTHHICHLAELIFQSSFKFFSSTLFSQ